MQITITDDSFVALFANATKETIVHLTYVAGREPSPVALDEAFQAQDWAKWKSQNEYVGHFESIRKSKKGEPILTLFVHNRGEAGKFRAFNPHLGTIKDLRIVNS